MNKCREKNSFKLWVVGDWFLFQNKFWTEPRIPSIFMAYSKRASIDSHLKNIVSINFFALKLFEPFYDENKLQMKLTNELFHQHFCSIQIVRVCVEVPLGMMRSFQSSYLVNLHHFRWLAQRMAHLVAY